MFVAAPEPALLIPFPESREGVEYFSSGVRFEDDLRVPDGVLFWDVDHEIDTVEGETKIAELKPKAL